MSKKQLLTTALALLVGVSLLLASCGTPPSALSTPSPTKPTVQVTPTATPPPSHSTLVFQSYASTALYAPSTITLTNNVGTPATLGELQAVLN